MEESELEESGFGGRGGKWTGENGLGNVERHSFYDCTDLCNLNWNLTARC